MARIASILSLLLLTAVYCSITAQNTQFHTSNKKAIKLFKKAEGLFVLGKTEESQKLLKEVIRKDATFTEAWILLGDIHSERGNYNEAVDAYQEALQLSPISFPYIYYLTGNLEFTQGNYENALSHYNSFLATENLSSDEIESTKYKIKNTQVALQIMQNPLDINLRNLGIPVNSHSDDYINFVDENSDFLYMTRKEKNPDYRLDGNPFRENFFYAIYSGSDWDSLKIFSLPVDKSLNTGALNFSIDRRQLFFTGCSWPGSFGSCDLYQIHKLGNNWTQANNLGGILNSNYWDSQAVLSSDSKTLYFASKRSGGHGGSDIWKSELLEDGSWGQPVNLGDSINTAANEMAPYIHADTKSFYFSSDRPSGLGGYDLFFSRIKEDGAWERAVNLGSPINTNANEINIFISIDATHAWISSDREGGFGGFDIYDFETIPSIQPTKVVYVKGTVIDITNSKPLQAQIELTNLDENKIAVQIESDPSNGSFFIPVYPGIEYAFNISNAGYLFYSENYNFKDSLLFTSIEKIFALTPLKSGNSMVLRNIFFDFDSDSLQPSSYPELDLLVELLHKNPEIEISIQGHTDAIGSDTYNINLSKNRAQAVRTYLIKRGINPTRLFSEGFGASKPIESNETPEGRAINRRTEIAIL